MTIEAPFDVKRLEVYSINGSLVRVFESNNIDKVNLNGLSKGKYLVSLYKDNSTRVTKKIVVK